MLLICCGRSGARTRPSADAFSRSLTSLPSRSWSSSLSLLRPMITVRTRDYCFQSVLLIVAEPVRRFIAPKD
jgi:hypothetical protein